MPQSPYLGGLIYGYRYIQSNGTLESQHDTLNFTGGGVTVTDDSPNGRTNVNITAGSSAINALVGDVLATGPGVPSATVVGLQTFPISTTPPSLSTSVLTWNGVWYAPAAGGGGGGSVPTGSGFTHITSGTQDAAASHGTADQVAFTNHAGTDIAWATVGTDISMLASGVANVLGLTGTAGALACNTSNDLQFQVSGTTRVTFDRAHGKVIAGGGGSDLKALIGPAPGSETTVAGVFLTTNGGSFTTSSPSIQSDGSSYAIMLAPTNLGLYIGSYLLYANNSGIQIFSSSISFGGGTGVLGVTNAAVDPTTNPTGGGIFYASGGAGKWRGSSGTTTTFGPAEPHCPVCGSDFTTEHESPVYGYLAICLVCLADELGDRPWIRRAK